MKLYYFDLYAKAEPIRLLLNHAKADYEDIRVTGDAWKELKANTDKCKFGQVPLLEIGGKMYAQQAAIIRYLGSKFGYYPEDVEERFRADEIVDLVNDAVTPIVKNHFSPLSDEEK